MPTDSETVARTLAECFSSITDARLEAWRDAGDHDTARYAEGMRAAARRVLQGGDDGDEA